MRSTMDAIMTVVRVAVGEGGCEASVARLGADFTELRSVKC